jgi:RimJ/RimL family protein N-acetyltransferase
MLRTATRGDFAFIHALASRPDYAVYITDEDDAALAGYLDDPCSRLVIWEPEGRPAGYALFCEIGDPAGRIELRRLALAEAGQGQGRRFLRELVEFAFGPLQATKLWLDASSENARALAAYDRAGFKLEGRLRRHWYRPSVGRTVDLMLYGMLREEWESLEPLSARP